MNFFRKIARAIWPLKETIYDELHLHFTTERKEIGWCNVHADATVKDGEILSRNIDSEVHINLLRIRKKYKGSDTDIAKLVCDALTHEYLHYTIAETIGEEIARGLAEDSKNIMNYSEKVVCLMHDHAGANCDYDLDNLMLKSGNTV